MLSVLVVMICLKDEGKQSSSQFECIPEKSAMALYSSPEERATKASIWGEPAEWGPFLQKPAVQRTRSLHSDTRAAQRHARRPPSAVRSLYVGGTVEICSSDWAERFIEKMHGGPEVCEEVREMKMAGLSCNKIIKSEQSFANAKAVTGSSFCRASITCFNTLGCSRFSLVDTFHRIDHCTHTSDILADSQDCPEHH
ncbi:hypothetical protein E1301_Tti002478 [Triplophysa tibetana]|uniref:Uncharacterized protein n=1 Tax=Triplophysa tibetana TaxID=1572043 RepID=A0A5A9NFE1_9TELE|nr:hypothetical protein E1301_Tti002478 [Triplophysa tibetana]